jgi:transcriptional regulator NrdR family protein
MRLYGSLTKAAPDLSAKKLWHVISDVEKFLDTSTQDNNREHIFDHNEIGESALLSLMKHGHIAGWVRYALVFHKKEAILHLEELLRFLVDENVKYQKILINLKRM